MFGIHRSHHTLYMFVEDRTMPQQPPQGSRSPVQFRGIPSIFRYRCRGQEDVLHRSLDTYLFGTLQPPLSDKRSFGCLERNLIR